MGQAIDLETACRAACNYCAMGMPLESDSMHVRPFAQFMDCGTDDHYPCKAKKLRQLAIQQTTKAVKK